MNLRTPGRKLLVLTTAAALTLGSASMAAAITFSSTGADDPITIPAAGNATPYPSTITVSGLSTTADLRSVTLNNLSHTWPSDIDVLLVSPDGQSVMLMSDIPGPGAVCSADAVNAVLTFQDGAPVMPTVTSGTYRPTDADGGTCPNDSDGFTAPAPAGAPSGTTLATLNNGDPNGTWSLFVRDDTNIGAGSIESWSLDFGTPVFSVTPTSGDFGSAQIGRTSTAQGFTVTNTGDAPLTITNAAVGGADADQFRETFNNCTGATLAPNGTCNVSLRLAPTRIGTHTAVLRFTSNAASSPDDVPLRGTGRAAPAPDRDQDGVPDATDNCPTVQNPNQGDADNDGTGNVCENPSQRDDDNDGVFSPRDNCPAIANPGQQDSDGDGVGDACERTSSGGGQQPDTDKKPINPAIKGKNIRRTGNDWIAVRAKAADGAHVTLYKVLGKNRRVQVDQGTLNANGVWKTVVNDTNGRRITIYKAVVDATSDTQRGVTNRLQQRKSATR